MTSLIRTLLLFVLASQAFASHAVMVNQYALVFFHMSTCSECHQFAPTMKQFEHAVSLTVYDFSFDGKGITGYPTPMPTTTDITNAFFGHINNAITPATFLINVNTGKYVRLSEGNVSYASLLNTYQSIRANPSIMESMQ